MEKYKLIKEYPGSPELGREIDITNTESQVIGGFLPIPGWKEWRVTRTDIKNNPEFWEKVEEKNYEILKLVHNDGYFASYEESTKTYPKALKHIYESKEYFLTCFLAFNFWKIHSIKRLNDGEIFSIGDYTKQGKIIEFKIKKYRINVPEIEVHFESNRKTMLSNLEKRDVLFQTEDEVEVFEGDDFYFVTKTFLIERITANKLKNANKTFSTKEAAEEYIIFNKPCLSINDIQNNCEFQTNRAGKFVHGSNTLKNLKRLVKERI